MNESTRPSTPARPRILIVEDEKPMARALAFKFTESGFDADPVFNGQEALDVLSQEGVSYDVVLLDLLMPVLDGFGVLEQLKANGSSVPVIVSTNLAEPEHKERALALGAVQYFVKSDTPITEVVHHVRSVLDQSSASA